MTAPFGLNILAQTVRDRTALMAWLTAAKPAAVVCMDDADLTQQIKAALPNSTVIHRAFNENDSKWHEVISWQEWLEIHEPFARNGVYVQLYNEPAPGSLDDFLTFLEDVCGMCPPHMRLALPNFSVGNPFEGDILAGKYDRLLRLVCGTRHVLALHEYFRESAVTEIPYLVGRFTFWQQRAKELGLPRPNIIITEHGRDIGGGRGDGWRGAGWSEQTYFTKLWEAQGYYAQRIPVCIFCWGTGAANHWLSFDIQDAPTLQQKLIDWNKTHPIKDQPVSELTPLGQYTLVDVPATYINVRIAPVVTSADIGDLRVGDVVERFAPDINGWTYVEKGDLKGWTSLQNGAVKFEPVAAPTPTPTPYIMGVDISQAQTPLAWNAVKKAGYSFAIARATQGIVSSKPVGMDTRFHQHIDGALLAGMDVGVYHAFIASVSGRAQAEFFFTAIAEYLDRLKFPPAIDVELTNGQNKAAIADRLHDMCRVLETLIGQKPLLYTSVGFWNGSVGGQWDAYFATLPLWIAQYNSAAKPTLPRCWSDWKLWQFTSSGKVDGYSGRLDLNRWKTS